MIPTFLQPEVVHYASLEIVRVPAPVVLPVTSITIVPVRPAITTALNDVVVVGADGLVKCCAWCLSARRLAELHRAHRCSDGLCPSCSVRLEQEVA
jgi:hypothetical protein